MRKAGEVLSDQFKIRARSRAVQIKQAIYKTPKPRDYLPRSPYVLVKVNELCMHEIVRTHRSKLGCDRCIGCFVAANGVSHLVTSDIPEINVPKQVRLISF